MLGMTTPRLLGSRARLAGTAFALLALAGCADTSTGGTPAPDGGSGAVPSVASLPGTTPTDRAAEPAVEGPLIRADTTLQEIERFNRGYQSCLHDEGYPVAAPEPDGPGEFYMDPADSSVYREAILACQSKKPESIFDRAKREHPQGVRDRLEEFVACMNSRGQNVVLLPPDGWGVSDEDAAAMNLDNTAIAECEDEVYGE